MLERIVLPIWRFVVPSDERREDAEIDRHVRHLLDRKQIIGERLLAEEHRVPGAIEKLHHFALAHKGELAPMAFQQLGQLLLERRIVGVNLPLFPVIHRVILFRY